jgi:hypothetical protein
MRSDANTGVARPNLNPGQILAPKGLKMLSRGQRRARPFSLPTRMNKGLRRSAASIEMIARPLQEKRLNFRVRRGT